MTNTLRPHHLCLHNFTRINDDYGVPLCEPWDSLLKRAEALHVNGDVDGAIKTVTAVYDKLVRHQIRALELKSRFHLRKHNYNLAFQDAIDVVHMAPLMALGYLLKVDVYLAQNQPIEALEVCREALQIIPPTPAGDGYRAVKARMAQVEAKLIDFTARLPVEILPLVFQNLTQHEILTVCMDVSKTWRGRLIRCAPLWKEIEPGSTFEGKGLNPAAYLKIASHVHSCYTVFDQHFSTESWTSVIYQGMKWGAFNNLRDLEIVATNQTRSKAAEILAALECVGKSLRKLEITIDLVLSIAQIQRRCPNLYALAYTNDTFFPKGEQTILASTNMQYLSVTIHAHDFDIQADDPEFKSSALPNLRRLHIGYSADTDLSLFDEYYPFLESLCFNTDCDWLFWDEPTITASSCLIPCGLSSLSINPKSIHSLMSYLEQHQDTIEFFHLDLNYGIPGFQPHEVLKDLHFGRLRRLTFTSPHPDRATEILDVILRGCVRPLEELIIQDFIAISMSTYQLMANLSPFPVIYIRGLANPEGLANFFETVFRIQQRQRQQQHPLKEVHLEEAKITDEVLESLAQLNTLQSVTISNKLISETYTNEGLHWFFGKHALHSSLRNITLASNRIDQITYKLISKIRSLETLTIPHRTLSEHQEVNFFQFMDDRPDVTVNYC